MYKIFNIFCCLISIYVLNSFYRKKLENEIFIVLQKQLHHVDFF
jgi:hypothetical protein